MGFEWSKSLTLFIIIDKHYALISSLPHSLPNVSSPYCPITMKNVSRPYEHQFDHLRDSKLSSNCTDFPHLRTWPSLSNSNNFSLLCIRTSRTFLDVCDDIWTERLKFQSILVHTSVTCLSIVCILPHFDF